MAQGLHCIVCSETDPAGMLVKRKLCENFGFSESPEEFDGNPVLAGKGFKLVTLKVDHVYADYVDKVDCDLLIFASRHESKTGPKAFTVHAQGNWGKADFGGKERDLAPTYASLIKNYLVAMHEKTHEKRLCHQVSVEQTHHGPSVTKPSVYIEMGSNESHWKDDAAAELLAETILERTVLEGDYKVGIGIGGKHYSSEFTKLMIRSDYALSHMCPEYSLKYLDESMLKMAASRTKEKVSCLVVDYKGIGAGEEKQRIKNLARDFSASRGLELVDVRKVLGGVKNKA